MLLSDEVLGKKKKKLFQSIFSGSTIGNFSKVDVSGCDIEKQACILKKGTNASIFTTFETSK